MKPSIIAHRGASGYAPENTMAAFQRALALCADAIELDVNQTADGELVVIHDDTLRRTTNGSGRVRDWTMAQLRELKVDGGERLSTLREVLDWANHSLRVWIEIKNAPPQKVLKVVETARMQNEVVIFSSSLEVMEALRTTPVERSLVFSRYTPALPDRRTLCATAHTLQLTSIAARTSLITCRFIEHLHAENLRVAAWTANRRWTIQRLLRNGADFIITNFPDRARKMLASR